MTKSTKKKSYYSGKAVDKDVGEPTVYPTAPIDENEDQELDEEGDEEEEGYEVTKEVNGSRPKPKGWPKAPNPRGSFTVSFEELTSSNAPPPAPSSALASKKASRPSPPTHPKAPKRPPRLPTRAPNTDTTITPTQNAETATFPRIAIDARLRINQLPSWDGDPDNLTKYLTLVEYMAGWSPTVYVRLGRYLPLQFTGVARSWWLCLRSAERERVQTNWGTLREWIVDHHLYQGFFEKQPISAQTFFRNWTSLLDDT